MSTYKLGPLVTKLKKESDAITAECYVPECAERPIKAHSVSEAKVLERISKEGHVLYFTTNDVVKGEMGMKSTGKGKATTFPGLCATHDAALFKAIDKRDYVPGDKEQEFLFAYRSAAREFSVRKSLGHLTQEMTRKIKEDQAYRESLRAFGANPEETDVDLLEMWNENFELANAEVSRDREAFNINMQKDRWWKINTTLVVLEEEYPLAVSSNFKLELDQRGNIINDILSTAVPVRMTYMNVFPQDGKTYALVSYPHRHRDAFRVFNEVASFSDEEKKVILSNMIAGYAENFAVNADYWLGLPDGTRTAFKSVRRYLNTRITTPLVADKTLSIFS